MSPPLDRQTKSLRRGWEMGTMTMTRGFTPLFAKISNSILFHQNWRVHSSMSYEYFPQWGQRPIPTPSWCNWVSKPPFFQFIDNIFVLSPYVGIRRFCTRMRCFTQYIDESIYSLLITMLLSNITGAASPP